MYTAFVLTPRTRHQLMSKFPPKYTKELGHHVTHQTGVTQETRLPQQASIKVVGYQDNLDGIEALIVTVNGHKNRSDGKPYHIAWSLDPTKHKQTDSNDIAANQNYQLVLPISISTSPAISD